MAMIEFEEGAIEVDVTVFAKGLGERMREDRIASLRGRRIDESGDR